MSLISLQFAAFVMITAAVYFLLPSRYRWMVLLAAGYYYYLNICNIYVIYMLVTTVTTWGAALWIARTFAERDRVAAEHKAEWDRAKKKEYKEGMLQKSRRIMVSGLLLNFGILAVLKYSGLAVSVANQISGLFSSPLDLPNPGFLLPLGISFYTFQAMGYLIDVYQETVEAEKNLAKFALFVSFFPQIIQGPIAMYEDLAPQLYEGHDFDFDNLKNGAALILWGAFKKMVIADRAVRMINLVTADSKAYPGTFVLAAVLLYAIQLYADFSGGIDIVRGVAQIFGIEMAENFRRPYFSTSLTEYWHRWHITLGNWVRKYVFYPISVSKTFLNMGRRLTKKCGKHFGKVVPTSLASVITFLVIGIWHGANGKYVAFGLWNGLAIMLIELMHPVTVKVEDKLHVNRKGKLYRHVCMVWTFLLVLIGYYFDIAQNTADAFSMMFRSVADFSISDIYRLKLIEACGLTVLDYLIIAAGTIVIFAVSVIQERSGRKIRDMIWEKPLVLRWCILWAGILSVVIFGYYGSGLDASAFVYMQF